VVFNFSTCFPSSIHFSTVAAAAKLGLIQPIPVIVARGWSELLFEAVMRDGFGRVAVRP
jgi:hypothetical protein